MTPVAPTIDPIVQSLRSFHFRGKARLFDRLVPRTGSVRARIFGSELNLDLEDFIQRHVYMGAYEPVETRLVSGYLRPGMVFVDVGANIGYYTALAAQQVGPTGRVVSYEPSPYAFERLKSMAAANRLTQVRVVNAGLSDSPGELNLYLGVGSKNHTPTMVEHEGTTKTEVRVSTLDHEAELLDLERINLLKIDVEGFELRVLRGADELLNRRRIRAILCEFNDHWLSRAGTSSEELERFLTSHGFIPPQRTAGNNQLLRLP